MQGETRRKGRSRPSGAVARLAGMARRAAATRAALARATKTLHAVLHLGHALSSLKHLGEMVTLGLVPELARLLGADRASVFLADQDRGELFSLVAMDAEIREIRFPIGTGLAGWVARTGKPLNVADAYRDRRFNPAFDRQTGYRTRSVLVAPMRAADGTLVGVIQLINKKGGGRFTAEDESLAAAVADEAAVAVVNARLVEARRVFFESCIRALAAALDARDPLTAGHTHRVTEYAVGIGRTLKLSRAELERIRLAGILHDMGKIGVPDYVLTKPWGPDKHEFEIMKTHAEHTRSIVRSLRRPAELEHLADEAALHHERVDGSGYPEGRKGPDIPLVARILAVADVFDAITSKRVYHEPMPIRVALAYMEKGKGTHFDPPLVDAFMRYYDSELKERFEGAAQPAAVTA